ncbi:hypothetical protein RQN30_04950 [Arcanobacterium hippocoleae]
MVYDKNGGLHSAEIVEYFKSAGVIAKDEKVIDSESERSSFNARDHLFLPHRCIVIMDYPPTSPAVEKIAQYNSYGEIDIAAINQNAMIFKMIYGGETICRKYDSDDDSWYADNSAIIDAFRKYKK